MTKPSAKQNAVLGTTEFKIIIRNLANADVTAKSVLEMRNSAANITSIDIATEFTDEDEAEDFTDESESELSPEERKAAIQKKQVKKAALLTLPVIQILNTILENRGPLTELKWREPYPGTARFTRPNDFWTAIYGHARTLQTLELDFFAHEVGTVPAPSSPFPALTSLTLDTSGAHGDDGATIATILKTCPELQKLDFQWPGCDLTNCQIQNIVWDDLTFKNLTNLSLNGWDFAPLALAKFLSRHSTVQVFHDSIDVPYDDADDPAERPQPLATETFPNLKKLYKRYEDIRTLKQYFDPAANRPIHHLALYLFLKISQLGQLASLQLAQSQLQVLELHGPGHEWRVPEVQDDSSDDDDDDDEVAQTEVTKPAPRAAEILQNTLPHLVNLQELGISLETSNTSCVVNGEWQYPDAANAKDLTLILSLLPAQSKIRALRIWDTRAKPLPQSVLDSFPPVPEGLEFVAWEGEERALYRLERMGNGLVKAVVCDEPRARKEGEAEEWYEKRVLEY